ncbi:hypothetical protein Q0Z83_097720 [Actinoplanes sichuanensis]|nr:hypothetical protein Q0Z83_097720 [Actinoplanes sichuanensis]
MDTAIAPTATSASGAVAADRTPNSSSTDRKAAAFETIRIFRRSTRSATVPVHGSSSARMPVSTASTIAPRVPPPVSSGSSTSSGTMTNQSAPKTTSSAANRRRKSRLRVRTGKAAGTYLTI